MGLGFTSVRTRLRKVTGTYWKERGHAERLWRLAPDGTFDAPDDTVGELLGVILRGISATMTSSEICLWGVTHPSALHPAGHLSLVHGDFGTKYSLETQRGSTFTSNAPRVFGRIRQAYGVSESLFSESMQSLHAGLLSQSKGKSSSLFLHTPDGHFIVKTLSSNERDTLMRFLPSYTVYLLEHPNTFLPWFLGCYESSSKKVRHAARVRHGECVWLACETQCLFMSFTI